MRYVVLTGLGFFIGFVVTGAIFGTLPEPAKRSILCFTHIADRRDCP